ncbi:hypothetical protein [Exiguobacterium sp. s59]|uniref:hypothetical protein n=1 Tax=Exiguobacterium sp. s59 TaxID=2751269 RepID=UPI001BEAD6C2|nr:hypothetical protein [Exiguobacterium sp. s59]
MNYFTFKLNLEPFILHMHSYDNHKDYVVGTIIPKALSKIFNESTNITESKMKYLDSIDLSTLKESHEFNYMIAQNKNMTIMYEEVVEGFNKGNGIIYTPEYLKQRNVLNKAVEDVIATFPFLKGAFELNDNIYMVDAFSNIKMAVTYIRKAKKIERYVNNFPNNIINSEFIYDKSQELIYISAENTTQQEAENYISVLEDKINNFSSDSNIGRISINPVYEEFVLEGKYSEITVELVYPNGHPSRDRSNAIKEANAAKEKRTFEASKGEKIESSKLVNTFEDEAQKGYVKSVTTRGKSIIKSVIKKVSF